MHHRSSVLLAIILITACRGGMIWPVEDTTTGHPVGNSSREFQQYGGAPYYHGGIDVREPPAPGGPWLRSVDSGTVALSFNPNPIYHGIMITNPGNVEFGYWHADSPSITLAVWNAWTNGTQLARNVQISQIVNWPSCNFHHVHFYRQTPTAETDPMVFVRPRNETAKPRVANIRFARNATDTYFGSSVNGDVDIVAEISDSIFTTAHLTGVYNASYKIQRGYKIWFFTWWQTVLTVDSIFPRITRPADATAAVVFKTTGAFPSNSNYCGTEVYQYVMTNGVETGYNDTNGRWDTDGGGFPDGSYRVEVKAWDVAGNEARRRREIFVNN